jgi:hypothetical protein
LTGIIRIAADHARGLRLRRGKTTITANSETSKSAAVVATIAVVIATTIARIADVATA